MVPRGEGAGAIGETMKSKCRVASNSVLAGAAGLVSGSRRDPDSSCFAACGTATVEGLAGEPG